MSLPEMKRGRMREVPRKKDNRMKKVPEAFFVVGPNAKTYPGGAENFIVKGGPGLGPIPKDGRWYEVTDYLRKCVRNGDAAEGSQAQMDAHAKATKSADAKTAARAKKAAVELKAEAADAAKAKE